MAAVASHHQRVSHRKRLAPEPAPDQFDAGDDVAPLVGGAGLQLDVVVLVEVTEVVGLQQHVAELGVRDAVLAVEARAHGILGDHLIDREVLADVTKELEHRDGVRPVGVVDQCRLERTGLEVEQLAELHLDALDVVPQRLVVEQVAFLAAPARVADHSGGAAGQRERTVTGELEAAHEQLADEVPGVQRVGRRVEPDVQADVALGQPGAERVAFGGVVNEPAGVEFGKQIHSSAPCCQVSA